MVVVMMLMEMKIKWPICGYDDHGGGYDAHGGYDVHNGYDCPQ